MVTERRGSGGVLLKDTYRWAVDVGMDRNLVPSGRQSNSLTDSPSYSPGATADVLQRIVVILSSARRAVVLLIRFSVVMPTMLLPGSLNKRVACSLTCHGHMHKLLSASSLSRGDSSASVEVA